MSKLKKHSKNIVDKEVNVSKVCLKPDVSIFDPLGFYDPDKGALKAS